MKACGEEAYYYVVSRTVGGEFYLGGVIGDRSLIVVATLIP
jgi:hypothetical protein